jgi:hypothetical protein
VVRRPGGAFADVLVRALPGGGGSGREREGGEAMSDYAALVLIKAVIVIFIWELFRPTLQRAVFALFDVILRKD